jgi:NAD kinase
MDRTQPLPRRIAIGLHPSIPDAASEAEQITQFLLDNGVEQVVSAALPDAGFQNELLAGGFDLLIALGGDGTMLRAWGISAF